jgi:regulatory protein
VATPPDPDREARLQHALDLAFRHLNRRDRTVGEMRRHLEGKGVKAATVDDAVAELERGGWLDDAGFAARFADDKRRLEGWGAERIERRLLERGVPGDVVRDALGDGDRETELEAALDVLRRRFPALDGDPSARRRAYGVLVRKGYDAELAADAVRAHARTEWAA